MFIGENYIYFELQKTASTQVRKILKRVSSLPFKKVGIHNAYFEVPKHELGDFETKIKIGSVRNPWDWYVSLWTWACSGNGIAKNQRMPRNRKGLIYFVKHPIQFITMRKAWTEVYSDPKNYNNFRKWLKMMLLDRKYEVGDGYVTSKLAPHVGYFTYCYLRLHTRQFLTEQRYIVDYDSIVKMDNDSNFIDYMIIADDFDAGMHKVLSALGVSEEEIVSVFKLTAGKANATKRDDYHLYYDEFSKDLVARLDKLIIQKYKYSF